MINNAQIMTQKGIYSVLIIDDDAKENFTIEKLKSAGFKDIIEQLEDDTSPDTKKIINILKSNNQKTELQDLINFIFTPPNLDVPEFFKQNLLNPAKEKFAEMFKKIHIIINCLKLLGIQESAIDLAINKEEAKKVIENNIPDLILIDFRLEDEGTSSIAFVEELIKMTKKNNSSTQFVLMSYDSNGLKDEFRRLHKRNNISSARFKVIEKPNSDEDLTGLLNWKLALIQIANEKSFMNEQEQMQIELAGCIEKASKKLVEKIWEMDSCYLNQLRLTAQEDHISLQKYLLELMAKNLLAEYEEQIVKNNSISNLEQALEAVENNDLIFSSSPEIIDPYEKLKILLADLIAYRYKSIKQQPKKADKVEVDKSSYTEYFDYINFGTILKDTINDQYYVNLTMPCDYIHSKFDDIKVETFIFIPGKKYNPLSSFGNNNKEFKSQHVTIQDRIESLKWELRKPETMIIKSVLDKLVKNEFVVVGQLRQEQAQAIITKFSTNISRIGLPRTPVFEYAKVTCYKRDDTAKLNCKKLKEATKDSNLEFTGRKYFNKENMNIVFSREVSISIIQKFNIEASVNEQARMVFELMNGITLTKNNLFSIINNKILVFASKDLSQVARNESDPLNQCSHYIVVSE